MINLLSCQHCGRALLPGMRSDARYCSGTCQVAAFRAARLGDVVPFAPPPESAARALLEPFRNLSTAPAADPIEAAMAEVAQAERRLAMARRAASKAYKAEGRDTAGMFGDMEFVPRSSAEKWVKEATAEALKPRDPESEWLREKAERAKHPEPKLSAFRFMAERAERGRQAASPEMTEAERRENAFIERYENASPEERAAMIIAAGRKAKGK